MYIIKSATGQSRFMTKLIRQANPSITFDRVSSTRGKLPQKLFDLLPSTGLAETPSNVPTKTTREEIAMRKVLRAFTRDGKYHDLWIRYTLDDDIDVHNLRIVFTNGKHYTWYRDNRPKKLLPESADPYKRKIAPLGEKDISLYNRALKLFPNNPSL